MTRDTKSAGEWRPACVASLILILAAASSASAQEALRKNTDPLTGAEAIDGIQLELLPPKLRLRLALNEIVVMGQARRDRLPEVARQRQQRQARRHCTLTAQSRGEGDPLRPQLDSTADLCRPD